MSIKMKYKLNLHGANKELCSNWTVIFKWDLADRAAINFHIETSFYDCKENLFYFLTKNFNSWFAIQNFLLIIFSTFEMVIAIRRLWDSYKNFLIIQNELIFLILKIMKKKI